MKVNFSYQGLSNLNTAGRYVGSEKGLHLLVKQNGKKNWIMRYTYGAKRHDLAFGAFPEISIAEAKKKAQEARHKLNQGINPIEERRQRKQALIKKTSKSITFKEFALSYVERRQHEWTNTKHKEQWIYTLKNFAFPVIGEMSLDEIDTDQVRKILEPIWVIKTETASRLRSRIELILSAATTLKLRSGQNPAIWRGHLDTLLSPPNKLKNVEHHKALPYKALTSFIAQLREMDNVGALALEFLILNASRTGEVIGGLRTEVEDDLWIIPAKRMKAKKEHRVPLCPRSLEILSIAKAMDEDSIYLFSRNGKKLSNMAMPMMLRRLKIGVTVHGFRSTFRDWVSEETDHSPEAAEKALAHTIGSKVEAAYRRGDLFERRRKLLLDWEAFCSGDLNSNVIALKAA